MLNNPPKLSEEMNMDEIMEKQASSEIAQSRDVTHVTIEDIIEGLTACICCDEPDSDKYRAEARFWLNKLADRIRGKE